MECNNYQGISLYNVACKTFIQLVSKYLEPYVKEILGDHQCSLCRGQYTTDQTFSL
jgi:hypothetical protein